MIIIIDIAYWIFATQIIENNFGFPMHSPNWWICTSLCVISMVLGGITTIWIDRDTYL